MPQRARGCGRDQNWQKNIGPTADRTSQADLKYLAKDPTDPFSSFGGQIAQNPQMQQFFNILDQFQNPGDSRDGKIGLGDLNAAFTALGIPPSPTA